MGVRVQNRLYHALQLALPPGVTVQSLVTIRINCRRSIELNHIANISPFFCNIICIWDCLKHTCKYMDKVLSLLIVILSLRII